MKNTRLIVLMIGAILLSGSCNKIADKNIVNLIPVSVNSEYQYINRKGKIVINPQFSEASVFRNGVALVRTTGENAAYGFINEEGKYIIRPGYKYATIFNEDIAWVVAESSAPAAIDIKNEIKFRMNDAYKVRIFKDGLAAYCIRTDEGLKWGFIDKRGKVVINPQFEECDDFYEGLCAVGNNDYEWGYIDKNGKLVMNYQFDRATRFNNNRAIVLLNDKWGVIDNEGKYVINPQFDNLICDGDKYLCYQSGKAGWCDTEGRFIINPQFDRASMFSGTKLAAVLMSDKFGFIDDEGKILINPQFEEAFAFNGKLATVRSGDKYGFIDRSGDYIINPQFERVAPDFFSYVSHGDTEFNQVKSDYFNVSAIVDFFNREIRSNSVSGYDFTMDITQILNKANRSLDIFSSGSSNTGLLIDQEISDDAKYTFGVVGSPRYISYNGWYSTYQYNLDYKPEGFYYEIWLSNNGSEKGLNVFNALENAFPGFAKDVENSTETMHILKNGTLSIMITFNAYALKLTITPDDSNIQADVEPTGAGEKSITRSSQGKCYTLMNGEGYNKGNYSVFPITNELKPRVPVSINISFTINDLSGCSMLFRYGDFGIAAQIGICDGEVSGDFREGIIGDRNGGARKILGNRSMKGKISLGKHNLKMSYNGTIAELWIDNKLVDSIKDVVDITKFDGNIWVGRNGYATYPFIFKGQIHKVELCF